MAMKKPLLVPEAMLASQIPIPFQLKPMYVVLQALHSRAREQLLLLLFKHSVVENENDSSDGRVFDE